MTDKVFAQASATIGSRVVLGARDLQREMAEIAEDDEQYAMLSKLAYGALRAAPDDITVVEILMVSDILAGWALTQIAKAHGERVQCVQQQWVLANAFRSELFPVPAIIDAVESLERKSHDEPS